jgi:hypothetical protein
LTGDFFARASVFGVALALAGCLGDDGGDTMHAGTENPTGGSGNTTSAGGSGNTTSAGGSESAGASGGSGATTSAGGSGAAGGSTGETLEDGTIALGVRWRGRVDVSDPNAPAFGWTASGFTAAFTGTSVQVTMNNDGAYFFQVVVDGAMGERMQAAEGTGELELASGLAAGDHVIELYRETESGGASRLTGITIDNGSGTLNPPPKYNGRLIETVGDSQANGYGALGLEIHQNNCSETPSSCGYSWETQTGYQVYGAMVARNLNADASVLALSGWGCVRDAGGGPQVMPSVYEQTYYTNSSPPTWGFQETADAVIVNIGSNDTVLGDPGSDFETGLGNFVDTLRAKNPDAWLVLTVGPMMYGDPHDWIAGYTQSVIEAKGGEGAKIAYLDFGNGDPCGEHGTGCGWHPNVWEGERIAGLLTPLLKEKLGW